MSYLGVTHTWAQHKATTAAGDPQLLGPTEADLLLGGLPGLPWAEINHLPRHHEKLMKTSINAALIYLSTR